MCSKSIICTRLIIFYNNAFKLKICKKVMDKNSKLKMAVIAGAVAATKYARDNKMATPEEIIRSVTKDVDKILGNIDTD